MVLNAQDVKQLSSVPNILSDKYRLGTITMEYLGKSF